MDRSSNRASELLTAARQAQQRGRPDIAEKHYEEILRIDPDHDEALGFVGTRMALRGNHPAALRLLKHAAELNPDMALAQEGLGIVWVRTGHCDAAVQALSAAVAAEPHRHVARLFLGHALDAIGQPRAAAVAYHRAITEAQKRGLWISTNSTAPFLLDDVKRAIEYVRRTRRQIIDDALSEIRKRHGSAALARVEQCVATYLGEHVIIPNDPRQRPKALFFPGLPTTPYLSREMFPWVSALEEATSAIHDELITVLAEQAKGFEPFLGTNTGVSLNGYLQNDRAEEPVWDAFFFYRHGLRWDENHRRCPTTSALLDSSPLAHIRDHAPEVCFSLLTPGTHILPHHGDTNTRVVLHLPLIVPRGCALNVGGEIHEWRVGEIVAFDDTFEHEAWNRGEALRVVLILDAWNPHLTDAEREALTAMVPVLGDFDRECSRV